MEQETGVEPGNGQFVKLAVASPLDAEKHWNGLDFVCHYIAYFRSIRVLRVVDTFTRENGG